jgi:hypothetical protein
MAFGDIFNSQQKQDTDQTVIDQVPTDVVVDTSIDTPAPIDTPTPIVPEVPDGTILPAENTFTEQDF